MEPTTPPTPPASNPSARSRRPRLMAVGGASVLAIALIAIIGSVILARQGPAATTPAVGTGACPPAPALTTGPAATQVITDRAANSVTTAQVGDIIEIDLDATYRWEVITTGSLQIVGPSGALDATRHVCVWRLKVTASGQQVARFNRRFICQPNRLCSTLIIQYGFVITTPATARASQRAVNPLGL